MELFVYCSLFRYISYLLSLCLFLHCMIVLLNAMESKKCTLNHIIGGMDDVVSDLVNAITNSLHCEKSPYYYYYQMI